MSLNHKPTLFDRLHYMQFNLLGKLTRSGDRMGAVGAIASTFSEECPIDAKHLRSHF